MNDKIDDLRSSVVAEIQERVATQFHWIALKLKELCESPIEEMLGLALITREAPLYFGIDLLSHFMEPTVGLGTNIPYDRYVAMTESSVVAHQEYVQLFPQQKIGRYRADFVLVARFAQHPAIKMVIECDGHDFHEKTKDQAQRDKERDRFFVSAGFTVMRFTGSEIYKDATACADEVIRYLDRLAHSEDQ